MLPAVQLGQLVGELPVVLNFRVALHRQSGERALVDFLALGHHPVDQFTCLVKQGHALFGNMGCRIARRKGGKRNCGKASIDESHDIPQSGESGVVPESGHGWPARRHAGSGVPAGAGPLQQSYTENTPRIR